MGERASCLFVSTEPKYFGTNPNYDERNADWAMRSLDIGPAKSEESVELCDAINPPGDFCLGAYERGFLYGALHLREGAPSEHIEKIKPALEEKFGNFQALLIQAYSVVGLFGYALYENSNLVRAYGGHHDAGITIDFGELQPEEVPHFASSRVISGQRFFQCRFGEFSAVSYGTELMNSVCARFLGSPLDDCLFDFPLHIESFVLT